MYGVSKITSEQNIMLTTFGGQYSARVWPSIWMSLQRQVS